MMILLFSSLFMACDLADMTFGGSRADQANNVATAGTAKPAEKIVSDIEEEEYSYNPNNKRDPFHSFLVTGTDSTISDNIPRTPLQKYEIGQYSLTGIIWNDETDRNRALVEDPEGIGPVSYTHLTLPTKA